jgi:exonuclease III
METKTNQRHIEIKKVLKQMYLIDIYRTFYAKIKVYTFFSAPHGTFSKIDHILGQKIGLNRHKEIEIIQRSYQITTD